MTRKRTWLVNSIIFLFTLIAFGSCADFEAMNSAFDAEYKQIVVGPEVETPSSEEMEYKPGVYELKGLIPNPYYTVDLNSARRVDAKTGYERYSWWLQSASGELLGSAEFDDEGERIFSGGVSAQGNHINILAAITKQLTTEYKTDEGLSDEVKLIRMQTAHILRCHAFNQFGDEYWDTALLYVIPASEEEE